MAEDKEKPKAVYCTNVALPPGVHDFETGEHEVKPEKEKDDPIKRVIYMDDRIVPGSFYVEAVWVTGSVPAVHRPAAAADAPSPAWPGPPAGKSPLRRNKASPTKTANKETPPAAAPRPAPDSPCPGRRRAGAATGPPRRGRRPFVRGSHGSHEVGCGRK